MYSYEVNLLCDEENCNEIMCSEPSETAVKGEKNVRDHARERGWMRVNGAWVCAKCKAAWQA